MKEESDIYELRTVKDVFLDFKGRRAALIKALTTDFEEFSRQCDPDKDNLCLYGFPTEEWEVNLPVEEVPPEIPEPVVGINFARDGVDEKEWLCTIAAHSDSWLLSVAFYFGARIGFNRDDRKRLFTMINDLPTIVEVVRQLTKKQKKEKPSVSNNHNSNKATSSSKSGLDSRANNSKAIQSNEEDDEEGEDAQCGACGESNDDGFWIGCDACEKWFHGKCVKITPARAERMKQYKCPSCSNKRARH